MLKRRNDDRAKKIFSELEKIEYCLNLLGPTLTRDQREIINFMLSKQRSDLEELESDKSDREEVTVEITSEDLRISRTFRGFEGTGKNKKVHIPIWLSGLEFSEDSSMNLFEDGSFLLEQFFCEEYVEAKKWVSFQYQIFKIRSQV